MLWMPASQHYRQMEVLEQAYEEQLELYVGAADVMRKTVETAAELLERTATKSGRTIGTGRGYGRTS